MAPPTGSAVAYKMATGNTISEGSTGMPSSKPLHPATAAAAASDRQFSAEKERPAWIQQPSPTSHHYLPPSHSSPCSSSSRPLCKYSKMLSVLLALSLFWFLLPSSALTALYGHNQSPVEAILKETPLIDTHVDFPIWLRAFYEGHLNFTVHDKIFGQVDFPRLKKGKLGAVFWSAYVNCPEDDGDYSDDKYSEAVQTTYEQIDLIHRLVEKFPDELSLTLTSSAIFHNHQFPPPYQTIGSVIGGEGLHSIGNKVSNLRMMHQLGMRYMTLTHNCHNIYADAAVSRHPPVHNGLSAKGKELILEFNRIGMMVDISHVSAKTMRDVLKVTEAPVIFSHSGANSVFEHPRNVPDDVLDAVKLNGGVVQANFVSEFLTKEGQTATLGDVADHIVYIGKRIGFEHVGIGSDFDGMPKGPDGLEDVSKYPALLEELWKRGLTYKELSGVVGSNLLRVMADVEAVAARSTRAPLEDDVHWIWPNETRIEGKWAKPRHES